MFYSTQILQKKGPLGTVWLACHMDKKLKRAQVSETNIPKYCDNISNPDAPLALRLSGQLLLGVVKLHSKKVVYLFQDANDALVKVKQAFKVVDVDLPANSARAPLNIITLPDDYELDLFGNDVTAYSLEPFKYQPKPMAFSLNNRDSLTLAEDSGLFGDIMDIDGERFEAAGEEMERELSLASFPSEVERLREAVVVPRGPAFDDVGSDFFADPGMGGDEKMAVPPDDVLDSLDVAPPPSVARPPSDAYPLSSPATLGAADLDMPGLDHLASLDMPIQGLDLEEEAEEEGARAARAPAARAARQAAAGNRRKKPRLDVEGNRPATQQSSMEIRALLQNRAPLLRPRGLPLALAHAEEDLAVEDQFLRPALLPGMAPELLTVYESAMDTTNDAAVEPRSQGRSARARQPSATPAASPQPVYDALAGGRADVQRSDAAEPPFDPLEFDAGFDASLADPTEAEPWPTPNPRGERPASSLKRQQGRAPELGDEPDNTQSSFTTRTRAVCDHLKDRVQGAAAQGGKRQRLSAGAAKTVSLKGVLEGQSRLEACRWFFELLVLQSKDLVRLTQPDPYADICITPQPGLTAV